MGYRLEPSLDGEPGEATAIEQEVEWLVQIETGSILSGVRQSTKTINVSTAVCVSQRAAAGIVFAPLPDRRCWLKRQRGLITARIILHGDSNTRRQKMLN